MRFFFIGSIFALTLASGILYWTLPEQQANYPVLYWMTLDDPIKRETISLYYEWREERGYPPVEVRIDNVNADQTKKLIQGVSGVGGDLIDIYHTDFALFRSTGMLMEVTEAAEKREFAPDATYESYRDYIVWEDRQYGFPRNVGVHMVWANKETFARYGIELPPDHWDWDAFETRGRQFVEAANEPGARDRIYFINEIPPEIMRRSLGLSTFNETMTASTLDDPRYVETLERLRRWTIDYRLMPTRQEAETYAADASGTAVKFAFFTSGRYAMITNPRWGLIHIRPRGKFDMTVVEPPHGGFRNTLILGGAIGIYQGTRHRKEALDFLEYLTSERFNLLIARSGDSLPPVPAYAGHPQFTRPSGHKEEWGLHEKFAAAAEEIGIPLSLSPYVMQSTVRRTELNIMDALFSGRLSPEEAARSAAHRINTELRLTLENNPTLEKDYREAVAIQEKIEAYRAEGRPVPAEWLRNPFHRIYYRKQGWIREEKEGTP